jgi:hypothetical protein
MASWLAASRRPGASGAWMREAEEDPSAAKIFVAAAFEGFPATLATSHCRLPPSAWAASQHAHPSMPLSNVLRPSSIVPRPAHSFDRGVANGIPARMTESERLTRPGEGDS